MKQFSIYLSLFFLLSTSLIACKKTAFTNTEKVLDTYVRDNYTKQEVSIVMRDSVKLHTTIYSPKDKSTKYPILLLRTPYSCRPYGTDKFREKNWSKRAFDATRKYYCISRRKGPMDE